MHQGWVKAFCHITGGGLVENLPRVLPRHLRAEVDAGQWSVAPVFGWLAHKVGTSQELVVWEFNKYLMYFLMQKRKDKHFMIYVFKEALCVFTQGNIPSFEMSRTFNCGIGGVLVVDQSLTEAVLKHLATSGVTASIIGKLSDRKGK